MAAAVLAGWRPLALAGGVAAAPIKPTKPTLSVSVIDASSTGYTFHVVGTN